MNYFEHHIGDYAEATSHLTFVEDAAYSRLIRKYYATERPLPPDVGAVQRLVGARTPEEQEAVKQVLQEFFTLESDGWHNQRCDEEIERYLEGEPEREAKKANEEARQKRYREDRTRMFEALRAAGQFPPWNTPMPALREAFERFCNGPETAPETFPATGPATASNVLGAGPATASNDNATATQSPFPTPHSPLPSSQDLFNPPTASSTPRAKRSRKSDPDPDWLADFRREFPDRLGDQGWRKAVRAGNARIAEGHTPEQFIAGAQRYHAHCKSLDKIGTPFVKQAASFLGPDKHFLEPWPVQPATSKPNNAANYGHQFP